MKFLHFLFFGIAISVSFFVFTTSTTSAARVDTTNCAQPNTCRSADSGCLPGETKSTAACAKKDGVGQVCCATSGSTTTFSCSSYGKAYEYTYIGRGGTKAKPVCPAATPMTDPLISTSAGTYCCTTKANMDKFLADYNKANASSPSTTAGTGSEININLSNPLKYDTVEGVLTSVMGAIKGIVATLALLMIVIGGIMYIFSAGNDGRMKTAKNVILAALIGLAIVIAAPAFLKEISALLGWDNAPAIEGGTTLTLTQIARNILNFLLSIIGTLAIIAMIISGIMYITSVGNETRMKAARQMFVAALIGITLAMASLILVTAVARFFV